MPSSKKSSKPATWWAPNPGQQTEALTRTEREVLYGGARGGGKTDASQAWLTRWFDNPKLRFLIIRRNVDDLKDWIARARIMWKFFNPDWTRGEVRLPSGATGVFGHLCDDDAYERYQGHEYQKQVIEELTHIPSEELYLKLIGSCRSTVTGLTPQVFSTTNPGNAGHLWVRKRFVDVAKAGETFIDNFGNSRVFIPARVEDNPVLALKDPGYIKYLDSLPKNLRQAWREGSWDDFEVEGSYYTKEMAEMKAKGRIGRYPHDPALKVYTWWDLGVSDAMTIGFFQVKQGGWYLIDYIEAVGSSVAAVAKMMQNRPYVYGGHWMPHDARVRDVVTGKERSVVAQELGLRPLTVLDALPVDDGINAARMRLGTLHINEDNCGQLVNALKSYRKEWDEVRQTFKAHPFHDWTSHGADMIRYWAMTDWNGEGGVKIVRHGA